ncbi:zinc finger E-box-binding homeobox 1-like [Lucilia sericata]|uniref:zinc finger E-box-binding homeobox 1-like n=1 Tax=Lucilia sericata TaxID=13632 RepID=UPI0018A8313B|nr:zinc finger E-box-binding homeobox 1-like [Lucilia sericata]
MVVSKRCKVCAALEAENIPISGEYFGKLLPELILKISGIDLDPRKINGVLICKSCAVQLVHTDLLVDKLRNTLQRLKKLVKETKPKTSSASQTKAKNSPTNNGEQVNLNKSELIDSVTNLDESKTQDEVKPKTPKKVARRKSVFPDDNQMNNDNIAEGNGKTPPSDKSEKGESDSVANLSDSKIQEKIKPKTPKKVARRKSVYPDDKHISNDEDTIENAKTPNDNSTFTKLKKKIDCNAATPLKKTPEKAEKRKLATSTKENSNNTNGNLVESTPLKRNKTKSISVSEDFPMDLTIDEQDGIASNNDTSIIDGKVKVINCSICGKAFQQKSQLREHIETSHMGERLKACPHCSSEFRSQQKYESHIFSEKCKNTNHVCQYPKCNKRFKTVHKMELHMHEKHSSQNESEAE